MLIYLVRDSISDAAKRLRDAGHHVYEATGDEPVSVVARFDAVVNGYNHNAFDLAVLAAEAGVPVVDVDDLISAAIEHPTEERCPEQCNMFMCTVMEMYRVHLDKNHDYSPANILATGEIGLATRLWDKVARFMNLIGFRVEISSSSFDRPAAPKHESIDDTLIDMATYAVIGMILRKGKWGK